MSITNTNHIVPRSGIQPAVTSGAGAGALGADAAEREQRVKHLFRLSTRRGLIHPLQHLLLRYRQDEKS